MDITKIKAKLDSLSDIMFDRFIDYSTERRPPEQKLYLGSKNELVLPQENIISFLFSDIGCAKLFEGKKGKQYIQIGMSHVFIDEMLIPFMDKNKPVVFKEFGEKLWVHNGSPITKKGSLRIKSESKERPVLKHPWSVTFHISILKNNLIDETKLYNWFMLGGMQVAIGTYRPRFGRFTVDQWEIVK
jgi:hypothetical protein